MLTDVFEVLCPCCGERIELAIENDVWGEMVQDCEVCCRPLRIVVHRDEYGDPQITVDPSDG